MEHRIKNLFSLASGVVSLSARSASDPQQLVTVVQQRLAAMARAQTLTLSQASPSEDPHRVPDGRIVRCRADDERVFLACEEAGGPTLDGPPETEGFGTRLSQITVHDQLGGEISRDWRSDGLSITFRFSRAAICA